MEATPGDKVAQPRRRVSCRKAGSRICHSLLAIAFFLVMVISFTSLGIFAAKHHAIDDDLPDSAGKDNCILYTTENQLKNDKLSGGVGCRFSIWGSAVVATGAGLFMLGYLIKTAVGASLLSCVVCLELPLLFLLLVGSLAVSINTTIGLALACKGFRDKGSEGSCKDYNSTESGKVKFFEDILTSEILSWAITGALLLAFVLYIMLTVAYFCTGRGRSDSTDEAKDTLLESRRGKEKHGRPKTTGPYNSTDKSSNPFL